VQILVQASTGLSNLNIAMVKSSEHQKRVLITIKKKDKAPMKIDMT
jgi:hypothetical protein